MFEIVFWGVRGSIPVPGPSTAGIGGNTSCVEVRCGTTRVVFDAGTGLRVLGDALLRELPVHVHLMFSHVHWDHIQGFPFFAPAFIPNNTIHMYGARNVAGTVETALEGQMESPNFPVKLSELPAKLVFHTLEPGERFDIGGGVHVRAVSGNHPGGVLAYRIDYAGKSVVYATDTEHATDVDPGLVDLARGCDVLIFDSMYTPEEYEGQGGIPKIGWGHSTFVAGAALANAAGVRQYVLFHHDPGQDDAAVRAKEARAQTLFANAIAAYEGLRIAL